MQTPSLVQILIRFLRLGLTAFGGPAMVPYIRSMAVEREQWLSERSFKLGMSVAQAIPGATAMQMAAYVGLRARGGPGALVAYFGFGLPAFLLMLGLSALYFHAMDVPMIKAAFSGLQLIVVALIFHAAINFSRRYLDTLPTKLLACTAGIWLAMGGNPILALLTVCALAVFTFRAEQGGLPPTEHEHTVGRPMVAAVVFALLFFAFLILLWFVDPTLFNLGLLMAKIDCFAYGGGYVSVPIMLHEVVEVRGWLTSAQFMDGIALGQITPGPIVMTAAFVGYIVAGTLGATVAAITVFTPSLIFVCAATTFGDRIVASPLARRALKGSLVSLVGLMAAVAAQFAVATDWSPLRAFVAIAAFLALRMKLDVLWVVLGGAALSALVL
ncbi:chromate efflux transporter [Pseudodesulfovibrio sp. zrk46]|uniref:chromate efflux transporter n=1 Tax=Pseudodesulfovibrio sp. zrk46 TaxID=2725288 RepID=UPI00144975FD|nr:chromate efflux transporter [Pseudodesulfovibrio sp. zrk46]QJB55870.1 chromate efflux transporter [Pseudodesulfovibrio sp. zrk46]